MDLQRIQSLAETLLTPETIARGISALLILVAGLILSRILGRLAYRVVERGAAPERASLARRGVWAVVGGLAGATALDQLGLDLTVLAGAAGVLTVAVGFASQTSASNMISGLFLIGERPFSIGDVVEVGGRTGEILSIDLLSTKIRTFDNLYVRVPNETIMKSEIVNNSRFGIRRIPLEITVAYDTDRQVLEGALLHLADSNPQVLDEPRPEVRADRISPAGLHISFVTWTVRTNLIAVKTAMNWGVLKALQDAGVVVTYPRVVVEDERSP